MTRRKPTVRTTVDELTTGADRHQDQHASGADQYAGAHGHADQD